MEKGYDDLQLSLGVPPTQASVVDASMPPMARFPQFIILKDAHRNPEVQSRLAWIVLHGYKNWGVNKVFMEGAFAPIDLSVFHILNDPERQGVSDQLFKQGQLSGAERAGIQIHEWEWRNPPLSPFVLVGIEDPGLYKENFAAYRQLLSRKEDALAEVKSLKRLHDTLVLPATHVLRQQLRLVEKMLDIRVTPAEYAQYLNIRSEVPVSSRLTPALEASELFYEMANRRSVVFVKNIEKKYPAARGPRILVVGGFHAPMIAQLLRSQGHSYVVFSPKTTLPANDALYERRLVETNCFF